jgi:Aminomethyltransferase folate-binding domain
MTQIQRRSPVQFKASIDKSEVRGGWSVVVAYGGEGQGPFLVDLSYIPRWELQDKTLDGIQPLGMKIPRAPGECRIEGGILVNRMNRTQVAVWHLRAGEPALPPESGYTDVTDATLCLALFGRNAFAVVEKLCALDFRGPRKMAPFLLQGPFSHVPCQMVILEKGESFDGGLLFTCSRGYAQSMVHAVLGAGAEFGLKPAGEQRFTDWLARLASRKD